MDVHFFVILVNNRERSERKIFLKDFTFGIKWTSPGGGGVLENGHIVTGGEGGSKYPVENADVLYGRPPFLRQNIYRFITW